MRNIKLARFFTISIFLAVSLTTSASAVVPPQTEIKEAFKEPACVVLKQSVVSVINGIYSDQDQTAVEVRNECASDITIDKIMHAPDGKTQSPYTHKYDASVGNRDKFFLLKYSLTAQPCLFPIKQTTKPPVACSSITIPTGGYLVLPIGYGSAFSMNGKLQNNNEKFEVRIDGFALDPNRVKTPEEDMMDISKRSREEYRKAQEQKLQKE
ncbi:MAG: hypothetical protein JNM12_14195 [Alphaproteobacteria bacterium]|nr:hypothetical protein [Alphaproteobacteria bacterium]